MRSWVRFSIAYARTTCAPTTGSATADSISPTFARTTPYAADISRCRYFRLANSGMKQISTTSASCQE